MGTTYVDPDGTGNYTSLAAWESGQQGALSEPEICICRCTGGTPDPGKVYIDGWITSDSNYIKITVEEGYRHQGFVPTSGNYFRCYQNTDGIPFRFNESYVHIDGLVYDFDSSTSRDLFETISSTPNGWLKFENCIANNRNNCNRAFDISHPSTATNQNYYVWNCISANMVAYGFAFGGSSSTNKTFCYNNTSRGAGTTNFRTYTIITIAKNCIAQDTSDNFSSGFSALSDTNASDNTDNVGENQINSVEVVFEDEVNGDLRLSVSDTNVKGVGLDLSSDADLPFDYDCAGNKRKPNNWDLGAYQVTPFPKGYHLML